MRIKRKRVGFLVAVITAIGVSVINILIPSITQRLIDAAVSIQESQIGSGAKKGELLAIALMLTNLYNIFLILISPTFLPSHVLSQEKKLKKT